jgi:hypothetical protein
MRALRLVSIAVIPTENDCPAATGIPTRVPIAVAEAAVPTHLRRRHRRDQEREGERSENGVRLARLRFVK